MPTRKKSRSCHRFKGHNRSWKSQLLKKKDNSQQTKTIQQCTEFATILEFLENTMSCPYDDMQNLLYLDHIFWEIYNIFQMGSPAEKHDDHETLNTHQVTHEVRASTDLDECRKECQEHCLDSMVLERESEELPYNLECSDGAEKLKLTLVSQDRFQENAKQQLMNYWRFIGGYQISSHAYYDALKKFKLEKNLTNIVDWAPIQSKTAAFLVDIGEYEVAEEMLNEVIQPLIIEKGCEAKELLQPLFIMVNLLFKKALQYVYGTHPGYRECRAKGKYYSDLCFKVDIGIYDDLSR